MSLRGSDDSESDDHGDSDMPQDSLLEISP